MLPMTWPLLQMIWKIHYHARPELIALINQYRDGKQVFHIRSSHELRRFTQQYCR
jgi:hypothetical protein